MSLLTVIIGLPLLTALLMIFIPRGQTAFFKPIAMAVTGLVALIALWIFISFSGAAGGPEGYEAFKFYQKVLWVDALDISYHVGVDGLNVGLILMGGIVAFAAICLSWDIKNREKEFYVLALIMVGGILGAFASLDVFFFYFFHELALLPTFIMIGVWGRGEERNYATFKMTMYLTVGALLALIGLVALYFGSGAGTFDMVAMAAHVSDSPIASKVQNTVFPILMIGFGILVSLWPFHTWAPLGYASAPTATAMLHAGVLKKFGLYGLIRLAVPLLPEGAQNWLTLLAWLCLGNILYCGWIAMRQKDLNYLIGNSSVAHMGFVFLGIASLSLIGITGAVVVMIAHGLLAALSFGISGYFYTQNKSLEIATYGGLLKQMPFVGAVLIMAMLAGCGLPGFANFAGEALVLFGTWKSLPWFVVAAAWGALVIGAIYCLRAIRNILHGPISEVSSEFADVANPWRKLPFALLLSTLLVFGFFPSLLVDKIKDSVAPIVQAAESYDSQSNPQSLAAIEETIQHQNPSELISSIR